MPPYKPLQFNTANSTVPVMAPTSPKPNLFVDTVKEIPSKLKTLVARGVPGLFSDQPAPDTFSSAFKEFGSNLNKNFSTRMSPEKTIEQALNFTPMGMTKIVKPILGAAVKPILGAVAKETKPIFEGLQDLSTSLVEKLKGRSTVSKQFISDLAKDPTMKLTEKNIINEILAKHGDKVDVSKFAKDVQAELLPLKRLDKGDTTTTGKLIGGGGRHESTNLPKESLMPGSYQEHIYESPIKTSAGSQHFPGATNNYFGHTRTRDLDPEWKVGNTTYKDLETAKIFGEPIAQPKIREVVEVQSDLHQKGNLERENPVSRNIYPELDRTNELQKLQQYNDPTAHFRMIREEIKKAAEDSIQKLRFPTGETAMKIEGLGTQNNWKYRSRENGLIDTILTSEKLKVGMEINSAPGRGNDWIITDVLGDGKFKAITKYAYDRIMAIPEEKLIGNRANSFDASSETFDISGKIDQNNPIYKFYEKEIGKFLKKFNVKLITDEKGVTWWEIAPFKGPVQAFGKIGLKTLMGGAGAGVAATALFSPSKHELFDRKEFEAREYQIKDRPVKVIEKELPEIGGVIFGEATASIDDMRKIANVVINRANASNKTILQELTKKTKNGGFELNAYGGKQYNKYRSNDFDFVSKNKAKSVDTVLEEIRSGKLIDTTNNDTYFSYSPDGILVTFDNVIDNIKHAQGIK